MQKLPEAETELRESRSNFKLHILQQLWLAWTNLCRQDWNERTFHNFRTGVRLAFVMQDLCKSTHPGRPESSVGPSRQQMLLAPHGSCFDHVALRSSSVFGRTQRRPAWCTKSRSIAGASWSESTRRSMKPRRNEAQYRLETWRRPWSVLSLRCPFWCLFSLRRSPEAELTELAQTLHSDLSRCFDRSPQ